MVTPNLEPTRVEEQHHVLVVDHTLPLREQLRHCLSGGPKYVDQLQVETGGSRKRILNTLNKYLSRDYVRLPSEYRNGLWGLAKD